MLYPENRTEKVVEFHTWRKDGLFMMVFPGMVALAIAGQVHPGENATEPGWTRVERVGPPTRYFPGVDRYRWAVPAMRNTAFYPVPQDPVSRAAYMRSIEASDPQGTAKNPKQGMYGPQAFMPVLAKYVDTGDRAWGEPVVAMLKAFHEAMEREVAERKWVEQFEFPAAYLPLYRKYLIEGGMMEEDAPWFRDLWLYYCRNLHVWGSEPTAWRGACHRSIPEAMSKGLATRWYPDIPEATDWSDYSRWVFEDFWSKKDVPQNDTGYMFTMLTPLICAGDQWTSDDRFYNDPGMHRIWERLLVEINPDGAINPYGPNGGWNSSSLKRLYMLERLAAKTGDGRYRFGAHKLFNYLCYQSQTTENGAHIVSPEYAALAWLFCDEGVTPVSPDPGSLWSERMEAIRVPHTDKAVTEKLLGHADPDPLKGHICCSYFLTGKMWPDKFIFRSGWDPGDFFALIELHPTSFPANPGGIMGLNRYGAPFTQIVTSKGSSVENRLLIEDVGGTASRRYHPDTMRIDENWRQGVMPDIRTEVILFEDTPEATYASLRVENVDALPVVYDREFIFVKNGFLATREIVTFEEAFHARVAPIWNTQNVGPQLGAHWANTFISAPVGDNGNRTMKTPPVDLLVWFSPREDCRLAVVDRFLADPRAID